MVADLIGYGYALVVAAGGVMGFVKKGSLMSGLMGLAAGGLAGFGAYQTSQNPNNYHVLLGTSAALTGLMGYRFISSGKVMPAGVVAALSLAIVIRYGLRAINGPVKEEK